MAQWADLAGSGFSVRRQKARRAVLGGVLVVVASAAAGARALLGEHFPGLGHFQQLIAVLSLLHLLGKSPAFGGMAEVFVLLLQ